MKKALSLVLALAIALSLVACTSTGTTTTTTSEDQTTATTEQATETQNLDPIVLGCSGPLTGNNAQFGENALNGIMVAIEEINADGGLLGGRMLEVRSYDDKGTGEEGASVAELLISDEDVCAVPSAAYGSSVGLVEAPLFQEAGLVAISNSASHPDFSATGDCIYRNNLTEAGELQYAYQMPQVVGAKKLGIVSMMSEFGESFTAGFEALQEQYGDKVGFEIACVSWFTDGTVDFAPNIAELINAGCDTIIFFAEYNNFASFAIQYRKLDPNAQFIGLMTCYTPDLVNLGGDSVEGVYLYSCLNPNSTNPEVQKFVAAYKAKYDGAEPDFVAANAYDSVKIIAAAIEQAGSADREAIREAIKTAHVVCTAGDLSFDANGDAVKSVVMFKIENGQFIEVEGAFKLWDEFVASLS